MNSHTVFSFFILTKQTVEHRHKIKCRTNAVVICICSKYNFEHYRIVCCTPKQRNYIFSTLTEAIVKVKTSFLGFYKPN